MVASHLDVLTPTKALFHLSLFIKQFAPRRESDGCVASWIQICILHHTYGLYSLKTKNAQRLVLSSTLKHSRSIGNLF